MMTVDPATFFPGRIAFVVPHMDDEALACGGLLARLPDKEKLYLIYATDGTQSPAPVLPGRDSVSDDLGSIRVDESIAAMRSLGIPERNLRFLRLPESRLAKHQRDLAAQLRPILGEIQPAYTFIPFRYDRHPDHLAVNHIVGAGRGQGWPVGQLVEYFVYYRSRLLPSRDIRKYIQRRYLIQVDIQAVTREKRRVLDCFRSQTTRYYAWQTRPILTARLLAEECRGPEVFLLADMSAAGPAVFARAALWIRLTHRLEPRLQRWKYFATTLLAHFLPRPAPYANEQP